MHAIKRVGTGVALGAALVGSLSTGAAFAAAPAPVSAVSSLQSTGSLTLWAADAANSAVPVPNVTYRVEDNFGRLVANVAPTGQNGTTSVSSLAPGSYSLVVVSWPAGYVPDTRPRSVGILAGSQSVSGYTFSRSFNFADRYKNQRVQLRNVKSGQFLDVTGASTKAGAEIIQYPDNNHYPENAGLNQQWTFENHNGHTRIVSKKSSQFVAVSGGSTGAGTGIIQWTATGGAEQDWDFVATGDGSYNIVNVKSGLLLAVSGGTTNAGERTIQWPATGGAEQKWQLVYVA